MPAEWGAPTAVQYSICLQTGCVNVNMCAHTLNAFKGSIVQFSLIDAALRPIPTPTRTLTLTDLMPDPKAGSRLSRGFNASLFGVFLKKRRKKKVLWTNQTGREHIRGVIYRSVVQSVRVKSHTFR